MIDKAMWVLPHPQPRPISDWEDAEANALEWVRWLGFAGARQTPGGADGGLDIEGPGVFGQVKFHGRAIAPNLIQQLFGARGRREGKMLFFSNSGYTKAALDCADDLDVSCFQYSPSDGEVTACNAPARKSLEAVCQPVETKNSPSRTTAVLAESIHLDGDYVEFSPDGSLIAYKDTLTSVRVEEWPSRREIATFAADSEVLGLEFVTSGSLAIHFPFLNETAIWDIRANATLRTIGERPRFPEFHTASVRRVECAGQVLTTIDAEGLAVWSTLTGEQLKPVRFSGASSASGGLVAWGVSPNRVLVACVCKESRGKRRWYLRIADQSHRIADEDHGGLLYHFAFTSGGNLMAAVGTSPEIALWDLDQVKPVGVLRTINPLLDEEEDSLEAVAFSEDDSLLAVGGRDKTVRLWNMSLREEIAILKGCEEDIAKISFSPDGRYLAASDENGTARLWDLEGLI